MFAQPSASSPGAAVSTASWLDDQDLLLSPLSPQSVLDYSFSDSFTQQNIDPFHFGDSFPVPTQIQPQQQQQQQQPHLPVKPDADETARQAALLHAYLAVQSGTNWSSQTLVAAAQERELALQRQEQERLQREKEERERMLKIQQADAQSLARYLAAAKKKQEEEIKKQQHDEQPKEECMMDCGDAIEPSISTPRSPSPSVSSCDSSSSNSPVMSERSPSPELSRAGSPVAQPEVTPAAASSSTDKTTTKSGKPARKLVCYNCQVTQTPLWRRTPDRKHSLCNACGLYYKQYKAHRPLTVRHKLPAMLNELKASGFLPYARPPASSRASSPGVTETSFGFPSLSSAPESSASSSSDSDSDGGHRTQRLTPFSALPELAKLYPPLPRASPPLMTAKQGIECANCSQTQTPLWRKNENGEPICNACGLYAKLHNRDRPVTMRKSKITRRRRDWGNLVNQAHAQAQALAFAHAQAQALVHAQNPLAASLLEQSMTMEQSAVVTMMGEMARKARNLNAKSTTIGASDSEEDSKSDSSSSSSSSPRMYSDVAVPTASIIPSIPALSNNAILDEQQFSSMLEQMNAQQMNKFLSILENRCGSLRERLLASTEATVNKSMQK